MEKEKRMKLIAHVLRFSMESNEGMLNKHFFDNELGVFVDWIEKLHQNREYFEVKVKKW